jgi:predicted nuclease of predicted toxin-antitoxin system
MSRTLKFHLDEHVPNAVAFGLRKLNIDVTTTADAGMIGSSDEMQLAHCATEQRILFTEDADFLLLATERNDFPGIIYCRQNSRSIGEIIQFLAIAWEIYSAIDMVGRVEFLPKSP